MWEAIEREKQVILYGQSARFRLVKYAILIPAFAALYWWKGSRITLVVLGIALVFAIAFHFFFRYKTAGWRKSYGPFKPLE